MCEASGDLKLEGSLKSLPTVFCQRVRCKAPATVIHAGLQLHDDGRKAVLLDVGYATSDNETTFETHCEATGHFLPVHQCKNVAIAACTHVHRTGHASNVNSHNCDCNPEFQETEVDERRCVEILAIVVVLVPKETRIGSEGNCSGLDKLQFAWPEAALP